MWRPEIYVRSHHWYLPTVFFWDSFSHILSSRDPHSCVVPTRLTNIMVGMTYALEIKSVLLGLNLECSRKGRCIKKLLLSLWCIGRWWNIEEAEPVRRELLHSGLGDPLRRYWELTPSLSWLPGWVFSSAVYCSHDLQSCCRVKVSGSVDVDHRSKHLKL